MFLFPIIYYLRLFFISPYTVILYRVLVTGLVFYTELVFFFIVGRNV
jgi:hypothetical protein